MSLAYSPSETLSSDRTWIGFSDSEFRGRSCPYLTSKRSCFHWNWWPDGKDHLMKDVTKGIADRFELSEDGPATLLPSGQQTIISNRVAWAKAHMKMAGLLENLSVDTSASPPLGESLSTRDRDRLISRLAPLPVLP